jgi:hypothetical protein
LEKNKIINPYKILLGNQGYIKIDDYEIAELKNLEIKIIPEMKEINLLNSVTKGKLPINFNGTINFEFNKIYSRFIPAVLESSKYLQLFTFNLEAVVYSTNKKGEERIFIGNCWIEGDIDIFSLKAENDFLTQKFQAGFQIETLSFENVITDDEEKGGENDWSTESYWQE